MTAAVALPAAATIDWNATTHDFGAFDEDMGPASCDFVFVNNESEPVTIVAARASCGCTTPKYPRTSIAPGDSATITVTYDPAGRPGRFTKYVAIDLSNNERTKLYIKGTVVGSEKSVARRFPVDAGFGMMLQHGAVMFGQLTKGHTRTAMVDVYNRSEDTIRPLAIDLPQHISMTAEPKAIGPGEQGTAIFYFNSAKEPDYGLVNDTVFILSNPYSSVAFPLPTVALVEEDFSGLTAEELEKAPVATLEAKSLDFGKIVGGGKVERKCILKNTGKKELKVRRLYSGDAGVKLSIDATSIKPGKSATITATIDPSKLSGSMLNARAALITNDPENPTQNIRLVGTVEK